MPFYLKLSVNCCESIVSATFLHLFRAKTSLECPDVTLRRRRQRKCSLSMYTQCFHLGACVQRILHNLHCNSDNREDVKMIICGEMWWWSCESTITGTRSSVCFLVCSLSNGDPSTGVMAVRSENCEFDNFSFAQYTKIKHLIDPSIPCCARSGPVEATRQVKWERQVETEKILTNSLLSLTQH